MKTSETFDLYGKAIRISCILTALSIGALSNESQGKDVYVVANTSMSEDAIPTAVFRFDHLGVGQSVFGQTPGSYFSIATNGSEFFVGSTFDGIRRFSANGDPLGLMRSMPGSVPRLELDSRGHLYVTDNSDGAFRLNADGTVAQAFTGMSFTRGIDADATGNVYVNAGEGFFKYDAGGVLLGFVPHPEVSNALDVVIDERSFLLYVSDESDSNFGVKVYDISGPLPTFLNSIPTPGPFTGISFNPANGHVFGTEVLAGRAWEITTEGTVVQNYQFDGTAYAFDVVSINAPEPSTAVIFLGLGSVGMWARRRCIQFGVH